MPRAIPSIDQLALKGTHNSYDQRRKVTVEEQVENYGVWVVELDYSVIWAGQRPFIEDLYGHHDAWFTTPPPCVIGHDGPGICADDAGPVFSGGPDYLLRDALRALAKTESSQYRPLVIYLDKKVFSLPPPLVRSDDPKYDAPEVG